MLFRFGKIDSPLCSFCKMMEETLLHLFDNCTKTKLSNQLKEFVFNETLSFPLLTPQSAILGHIDLSNDYLFYIYNSRNRNYLNIEHLKAIIDKTERNEEGNMNLKKDLSIL